MKQTMADGNLVQILPSQCGLRDGFVQFEVAGAGICGALPLLKVTLHDLEEAYRDFSRYCSNRVLVAYLSLNDYRAYMALPNPQPPGRRVTGAQAVLTVNGEQIRSVGEFKWEPKCECGCAAVGSQFHSSWCPLAGGR